MAIASFLLAGENDLTSVGAMADDINFAEQAGWLHYLAFTLA